MTRSAARHDTFWVNFLAILSLATNESHSSQFRLWMTDAMHVEPRDAGSSDQLCRSHPGLITET